jgi:hypothetical protein
MSVQHAAHAPVAEQTAEADERFLDAIEPDE